MPYAIFREENSAALGLGDVRHLPRSETKPANENETNWRGTLTSSDCSGTSSTRREQNNLHYFENRRTASCAQHSVREQTEVGIDLNFRIELLESVMLTVFIPIKWTIL